MGGVRADGSIDSVSAETSLYRSHRPQSFDQVVGQEHVVRTLSNAVERDRVHHAYLFVDSHFPHGVSVGPSAQFSERARIFASDVLPVPREPTNRYA